MAIVWKDDRITQIPKLSKDQQEVFDEVERMNRDHAKQVLEKSIKALKQATSDAEQLVGDAIELLDSYPVAGDGHYADPKRRASDLAKAKVLIDRAISIIDDTQWPKGE